MEKVFRNFIIYNPQEPPTEEEINAIETLLEAKLPQEFLDFLTFANGGTFNYCIEIPQINDVLSFCSIFSTKDKNSFDNIYETFIYEIKEYRKSFNLPPQVLPFAVDGGGSPLFLDLTESGKGRIVAFVHGLPEWTGRAGEDAFIEIASGFDSYLEKLSECEDFD